jgi:branched-chain amino acid transport system ATP-binding protein
MVNAIKIIQSEHQRVEVVLQCLESVIRDIEAQVIEPDFELLHAVVNYMSSFLFRFHHPKEEFYVFRALRRRYPPVQDVLDELEEEHRRGDQLIEHWRHALVVYEYDGASVFDVFRKAASTYSRFERRHMAKEEREILALAREYLTGEDWAEIDAEFCDNKDPLFGEEPEQQFQKLFSTIIKLASRIEFAGLKSISRGGPREDP